MSPHLRDPRRSSRHFPGKNGADHGGGGGGGGGAARAAATLALGLGLAACGSGGASTPSVRGGTPAGVTGTITVFAAASLTGAFDQIGTAFQAAHPGTRVVFNFGASSALAQQILAGAPADVFAAASPATMATVTDAGDAAAPTVFVRNRLEIAVPKGNPGKVTGLRDFARPDLTLALCAPEVPCGAAATKVFAAAGITPAPDTLEFDVKAALSKVSLGEVDAALVYRTDVIAASSSVIGIDVPEAAKAVNDYPIAALRKAPNPATAQEFLAFVLGAEGQGILAAAGFDRP